MSVIYDAGVFIAADRNHRDIWADHRARLEAGLVPLTTAPVVAQVSRSPKQAQMRRFLRGCETVGFGENDSNVVGLLLAKSGTSDVVDAHIAVVASRTARLVITSDPDDLQHLAALTRPRFPVQSL